MIEIRTRWIWRLGCPMAAATYAWYSFTDGDWRTWAALALFCLATATAWRHYLRIADGVLLRRDLTGWSEPLIMDSLASVSYYRGGRRWTPYLVLSDRNGTTPEISLRWWSRSRLLLDAVRSAADRSGAALDAATEARLGPRRVA